MIVATAAVVLLTVLLGGCQPAPAPKPATSQDIGFTIYCQSHKGIGVCP